MSSNQDGIKMQCASYPLPQYYWSEGLLLLVRKFISFPITSSFTPKALRISNGVYLNRPVSLCYFSQFIIVFHNPIGWGLDEAQPGIKIARRNINNLRYTDDTTLMAESKEELKALSMKVKEESEKVGLKLNIQKMKIMASDHITSWQTDGETMETVTDFIFWGSKITADVDCSHEIKRRLLLRRKAMTKLDSILKSKDITLPTEAHLIKAIVFPVVMYGCESWAIKKAGCWRIDAFELLYWRRLLRVPWTARRSNQSILFIGSPKYSLEGLMLKLKLQYFGHLMQRADSLEKTQRLKAGGEGRDRGWDGWMASPTRWNTTEGQNSTELNTQLGGKLGAHAMLYRTVVLTSFLFVTTPHFLVL